MPRSVAPITEAITITFCDCAENHVGMQQLGAILEDGFTIANLKRAQRKFDRAGVETELILLNDLITPELQEQLDSSEDAVVLVIRKGLNVLLSESGEQDQSSLYAEMRALTWDSKYYARVHGGVVNKLARHNLCFSDQPQEPDYQNQKGRVIAWDDVPLLSKLRRRLGRLLPDADQLLAEGNHYYNLSKCGIGYHGDAERKRVIGVRLGDTANLVFQWYQYSKTVSEPRIISLNHGDIYVMNTRATGNNWRQKKQPTLRHAAGCTKYTLV